MCYSISLESKIFLVSKSINCSINGLYYIGLHTGFGIMFIIVIIVRSSSSSSNSSSSSSSSDYVTDIFLKEQ